MKPHIYLGVLLAGLLAGCIPSSPEKGPDAESSGAEVASDSPDEALEYPAAVLTVGLAPLRDGLAASVHRGPKRGVRRVLKGADLASDLVSTATAGRAATLFKERSDLCPSCGVLQATIQVEFENFSPRVGAKETKSLGTGSVHVAVPVRAQATRSMSRPGWWEVRLVRDSSLPSSAEWVRRPTTLGPKSLYQPLINLGLEVAEAEAAMLPQRSPLLEFLPWASGAATWRVERIGLRLSKRLIELRLFVGAGRVGENRARASGVVVLGSEFQMMVSGDLGDQLGSTEEAGQTPPGRGALEAVLLADARGRLGQFSYSGPDEDGLLFSGSFARSSKALSLPQKPRRPGETGRLPRSRPR